MTTSILLLSLSAATYADGPPPTLLLQASPQEVAAGGAVTLSWDSQNTTSCTASGGWSGAKDTSGTEIVEHMESSETYGLACAGTVSASAAVTVAPAPQPALRAFSGVNGALWGGVDPVKAVQFAKNAGFVSVRDAVSWKDLEKTKGVYAWSPELARKRKSLDLQLAAGMQPLVILSYGNSLYPGTGTSPAFIDGYTNYAKWVATELKGSVRHYEVWNEWNGGIGLPCTWKDPRDICTGQAYTKLLCPVYAALKQVDPLNVVVGGAIAGGFDNRFIAGMLATGGMQCLDVLSLHLYRYLKYAEPVEVTLEKLKALHASIKAKTGRDIPFYITETGVTVFAGSKHTLQDQADYFARFYLAAKAYPFMKGIWAYSLKDVNARDVAQSSFGMMQRDFTPKPAYHAMQDVAGLFATSEFVAKIKSPGDILLLKLREPNGSYTYAVWSTRTSTKLILDAPAAGTLNIQKVGSDPIVSPVPFNAGSGAISVDVSNTPSIIRPSVAEMDITAAE